MALDPGTRLGPYEIEVQLGVGGMGEVYRARDTRLGRTVAIKVLPEGVDSSPERRDRFDREARAIASLSHPHICALFDVGSHQDIHYLVMEHLEGSTLADRLAQGPIPVPETLRLGSQIAGALAAAHSRGIIHRDLKPANIMLTPGGAKVLDFGLAKSLESEEVFHDLHESPTVIETAAHVILGTAAYMSPEQARGKPLDHRSDAWSFGVVLFEMLSGKRLLEGETAADLISAVLNALVVWSELPPDTPQPVRKVLRGLLERDVERRTGDLLEVARQLDVEASSETGMQAVPIADDAGENSIVVLPFANQSPDPENEYFSDGLTEEVIADLSKVGTLRVISRTTAMRLKETKKDLKQLAAELEVRYALEGSVRKAGNNLRITAQLIDIPTDAPLWSDKYSGTLDDVFQIQEEVSRAIVESLRVTLTPEEDKSLAGPQARNAFAYDVFLRARRDIWTFKEESIDRARRELEHALEVVGDDVLLYKGLGLAWWQYVNGGITADEGHLDKTEGYARKILELEPGSPHGTSLLGFVYTQRGDIANWIRSFREAWAADPGDPDHGVWLGLGWAWAGFGNRARPVLEHVLSRDPYHAYVHFGIGMIDYYAGRFAEALEHWEYARSLLPEHPAWMMICGELLASLGYTERLVREVNELAPAPESHPLANLAHILKYAAVGDAEAVDRLDSEAFRKVIWGDLQYTLIFAQALSLLGRQEESLRWLERAFERGSIAYPFISRVDPLLENVRGTPRFKALMVRMKARYEGFEAEVGVG